MDDEGWSRKRHDPAYLDHNAKKRIKRSIKKEFEIEKRRRIAVQAKKRFDECQARVWKAHQQLQSNMTREPGPEPVTEQVAAETMAVFSSVLELKQRQMEETAEPPVYEPTYAESVQLEPDDPAQPAMDAPGVLGSATDTADEISVCGSSNSSLNMETESIDEDNFNRPEDLRASSKSENVFSVFYGICHQFGLNDRAITSISSFINGMLSGNYGEVSARAFPVTRKTLRSRLTGPRELGVRYHWRCTSSKDCGKWSQCLYDKKLGSLQCCGNQPKPTDTLFMTLSLRKVMQCVLPNVFPFINAKLLDYDGFRRIREKCTMRPDDVILILNTDGVALTNSSRKDAWPVLASIAGTPEFLRFDGRNLFVVGIWTTIEDKIDIVEMLRQISDQVIETQRTPIQWVDSEGKERFTRVFIGPVATDSQARPKVSGLPHFLHTFGCMTCKHENPGHYFSDTKTSVDRTHEEYEFAASFLGLKQPSVVAEGNLHVAKQYPLNFRSPFCDVPGFDIIEGLPIDCMHAFGHGVFSEWVKMLLNAVKDTGKALRRRPTVPTSQKSSESGSSTGSCGSRSMPKCINTSVAEVSATMKRIKPPTLIRRRPRGLEHSQHYKAHEWTSAATVYLPPILKKRLSEEKFRAYVKLLYAFEVLNKHGQSELQLRNAERALASFSTQMRLGSTENVKYNVHQLRHATKFYRLWGPLYVYSTAAFENFNSFITRGMVKNQHAITHFVKNYSNFLLITGGRRPKFVEGSGEAKGWTKKIDLTTISLRKSMVLASQKHDQLRGFVATAMERGLEYFQDYSFYRIMESKFTDGHQLNVYASETSGDVSHNSSHFLTTNGTIVEVLAIALDTKNDLPKVICKSYKCRRLEPALRNFMIPLQEPTVMELCPSMLRKPVVLIHDAQDMYFVVLNTSVIVSHQ